MAWDTEMPPSAHQQRGCEPDPGPPAANPRSPSLLEMML